MNTILRKQTLGEGIRRFDILAPRIAKKAKAGQFVILRATDDGERIPLTIAHTDPAEGSISLIVQLVGGTTMLMDTFNVGESFAGIAGPLGKPTEIAGIQRAIVIGGGVGCAIAWPVLTALTNQGTDTTMIAGFRNSDFIILAKELKDDASRFCLCTDDGSAGRHGFVTDALRDALEQGESHTHLSPFARPTTDGEQTAVSEAVGQAKPALGASPTSAVPASCRAAQAHVFAIGPLPMMRAVSQLCKEFNLPVTVSMNPLMLDGTGMCGCCRLTVGGEVKFACVDGPDFDGTLVDWNEAIARGRTYTDFEQHARDACKLLKSEPKSQTGA